MCRVIILSVKKHLISETPSDDKRLRSQRSARSSTQTDHGWTLTHLIIAIVIIGIASSLTFANFGSFKNSGHDNNALASLEKAATLAERIYQSALPNGQQNFVGILSPLSDNKARDALNRISDNELKFVTYTSNWKQNNDGDPASVWVDINESQLSHLGVKIRAGKLIRLGVKSLSGATFCAVIVKEANPRTNTAKPSGATKANSATVTGVGYQAAFKGGSMIHPGTGGGFADCGADAPQGEVPTALFVNELPGQTYVSAHLG